MGYPYAAYLVTIALATVTPCACPSSSENEPNVVLRDDYQIAYSEGDRLCEYVLEVLNRTGAKAWRDSRSDPPYQSDPFGTVQWTPTNAEESEEEQFARFDIDNNGSVDVVFRNMMSIGGRDGMQFVIYPPDFNPSRLAPGYSHTREYYDGSVGSISLFSESLEDCYRTPHCRAFRTAGGAYLADLQLPGVRPIDYVDTASIIHHGVAIYPIKFDGRYSLVWRSAELWTPVDWVVVSDYYGGKIYNGGDSARLNDRCYFVKRFPWHDA
jgi:hypothetical protein